MIFRQCANTIRATKTPLGDYFRHMKAKGGHLQAMVATGKKLATIFYTMIAQKQEYDESIYTNHHRTQMETKVSYLRKKLERMELELANCG